MTERVEVWSDIHCPWALIAVHRLRRARERLSADVVFVPRACGAHDALDLVQEYRTGSDTAAVMRAWRTGNVRADVVRDFEESQKVTICGSPQIVWPDGTSVHNPGITDHYWRGGLPRINSVDPGEPERLLLTKIGGGHRPA